ncbi:MAG: hypothetical protein K0S48_2054 [Ramlibacter sp.]|jgi:hypothetical protein|nr:hypothetical protein [Ramlibacter sp.]MCE3273483.1 hypothetical protein [Ramlibacter sp.]
MNLAKTDAGMLVLRDRHAGLTQRQRAALILFDGQRTLEEVLAATSPGGVTRADIDRLVEMGLVAELGTFVASAPAPLAPGAPPDPSDRERYLQAYPLATQLTAQLGPPGEALHLAVEAAANLAELQALAPQIRAAVGASRYTRLGIVLRAP